LKGREPARRHSHWSGLDAGKKRKRAPDIPRRGKRSASISKKKKRPKPTETTKGKSKKGRREGEANRVGEKSGRERGERVFTTRGKNDFFEGKKKKRGRVPRAVEKRKLGGRASNVCRRFLEGGGKTHSLFST